MSNAATSPGHAAISAGVRALPLAETSMKRVEGPLSGGTVSLHPRHPVFPRILL